MHLHQFNFYVLANAVFVNNFFNIRKKIVYANNTGHTSHYTNEDYFLMDHKLTHLQVTL